MVVLFSDMGRCGQLPTNREETFLERGERQAIERATGDYNQIAAGRKLFLMAAKKFTQTTLGAVALHGVADSGG